MQEGMEAAEGHRLILSELFQNNKLWYAVFQLERCPTTERLHFQGFLELKTPQRISGVKRYLQCNHIHCEPLESTSQHAKDYCTKTDTRVSPTFWEVGVWRANRQGARTDIDDVRRMVMERRSLLEIGMAHTGTFLRYHRGIQLLLNLQRPPPRPKIEVHLYVGPPGCGKSYRVASEYPEAFWKSPGNKWWDGYSGQEVVVLDDYHGNWMGISILLNLLQPHPCQVEVKGGMMYFHAKTVVLTSNKSIGHWYNWGDVSKPLEALSRRVTNLFQPTQEAPLNEEGIPQQYCFDAYAKTQEENDTGDFPLQWEYIQ